MHPVGVAASLLALLAANGTSVLDCVCTNVNRRYASYGHGGEVIYAAYCSQFRRFDVSLTCDTLWRPTVAVRALLRLLPTWTLAPRRGYDQCDDALDAIQGLTNATTEGQFARDLMCSIADGCLDSCSVLGSNDTEWNVETLQMDNLRKPVLAQLEHTVRRITIAIKARKRCAEYRQWNFLQRYLNETEFQTEVPVYLEHLSNYTRDAVQLLSRGVRLISQLFVPLVFEIMDDVPNDQRLQGWINDVQHVRDMLDMKLSSWVQDTQYVSEQIANYKIEEDKNMPGKYIIRLPLLNDGLVSYHTQYLSFRHEFSAQCEQRQPDASVMFGLADALYGFYRRLWFDELQGPLPNYEHPVNQFRPQRHYAPHIDVIVEEWQLEDRSNATLSVDTGCMQLLADSMDHPTCPLEDLPPETTERRERCRVQLWNDLVQSSPNVPAISYPADTPRANVSFCLLAWMAANSFSVCRDVPFSMIRSVHDARCVFDTPDDQSCLKSNSKDAICSVSRAILLLNCRDFPRHETFAVCGAAMDHRGWYSPTQGKDWRWNVKPTERRLTYKYSLNNATLKYKDFTIDSLKSL